MATKKKAQVEMTLTVHTAEIENAKPKNSASLGGFEIVWKDPTNKAEQSTRRVNGEDPGRYFWNFNGQELTQTITVRLDKPHASRLKLCIRGKTIGKGELDLSEYVPHLNATEPVRSRVQLKELSKTFKKGKCFIDLSVSMREVAGEPSAVSQRRGSRRLSLSVTRRGSTASQMSTVSAVEAGEDTPSESGSVHSTAPPSSAKVAELEAAHVKSQEELGELQVRFVH
ncbi:MAG: hypothetical protein MHM6MM_008648 [Cercozoa sp. M6MM]